MSADAATKQDTKQALLEAGMNIMMEKGYTNTGIMEVLSTVGVPKGSFYHFFESKEEFALAIIAYTDSLYAAKSAKIFSDSSLNSVEKLKKYCQESREGLAQNECRKGCLFGNLSQEMADQSEVLRAALVKIMDKGRSAVAELIAEGQKNKLIKNQRPAEELAEVFQCLWTGAVLRTKTIKNLEPIDAVIKVLFEDILETK